jgi:hypothetical protein
MILKDNAAMLFTYTRYGQIDSRGSLDILFVTIQLLLPPSGKKLSNIILNGDSKISQFFLQYDDLNTVETNFFQW